jgi:hypothetical protein
VLVPDTSRGGRAGRKFKIWTINGGHLARQNAQDSLAMTHDTQEIAKSFWSYSYGGLSQVYV